MFKKLVMCLVLVMFLAGPLNGLMAAEDGDECTLKKGMKVVQLLPDRSMRGIIVPADVDIKIGPEIPGSMVGRLNALGGGMEWTGGNMGMIEVDFGNGPVPIMLIVKDSDVDCN